MELLVLLTFLSASSCLWDFRELLRYWKEEGREGGRERKRKGGKEEGREGGREGRRKGEKEEGREGGREGRKKGRRKGKWVYGWTEPVIPNNTSQSWRYEFTFIDLQKLAWVYEELTDLRKLAKELTDLRKLAKELTDPRKLAEELTDLRKLAWVYKLLYSEII